MLDYESLRKRFTETLNSYSKDDLVDWKEKMNNNQKKKQNGQTSLEVRTKD